MTPDICRMTSSQTRVDLGSSVLIVLNQEGWCR